MVVLTNPTAIANEIDTIHALFENGLELLHIRKPNFSELETKSFLLEIKQKYRQRLVLHYHHHLGEELGIRRLHFTQKARHEINPEVVYLYTKKGFRLSTSTHSVEEFNALNILYDYAFLSPVFPSISKANYQSEIDLFEAIKSRTNFSTQLVALGGITSENCSKIIEAGFDEVALLGSIWTTNNSIENYKLCHKIDLSF